MSSLYYSLLIYSLFFFSLSLSFYLSSLKSIFNYYFLFFSIQKNIFLPVSISFMLWSSSTITNWFSLMQQHQWSLWRNLLSTWQRFIVKKDAYFDMRIILHSFILFLSLSLSLTHTHSWPHTLTHPWKASSCKC